MLERKSDLLMLIQTLNHISHCKSENRMAVLVILEIFFSGVISWKLTHASIVLNIEWLQFVLQNWEILHSFRGLYDKNRAS